MKHIKTYEEKQEISQEEKDLNNLAKRIEYNINKYLNFTRRDYSDYIRVFPSFNKSGNGWRYQTDYDIDIHISHDYYGNKRFENIIKYFKDKQIKINHGGFKLSTEQAKDFLKELKVDFIYTDVEKYNL